MRLEFIYFVLNIVCGFMVSNFGSSFISSIYGLRFFIRFFILFSLFVGEGSRGYLPPLDENTKSMNSSPKNTSWWKKLRAWQAMWQPGGAWYHRSLRRTLSRSLKSSKSSLFFGESDHLLPSLVVA